MHSKVTNSNKECLSCHLIPSVRPMKTHLVGQPSLEVPPIPQFSYILLINLCSFCSLHIHAFLSSWIGVDKLGSHWLWVTLVATDCLEFYLPNTFTKRQNKSYHSQRTHINWIPM